MNTSHGELVLVEPASARSMKRFLARVLDILRTRHRNRVMHRELMSLDDQILGDIGLRRDDLRGDLTMLTRRRDDSIAAACMPARRTARE